MHSAGAARATCGARRERVAAARHGDGAARRADGGTTSAQGRRRGTAAHRRGVKATGERREAVGLAQRRSERHGFGPWLGRDGGATGEASCREAGGASEAGCRDSGFKPRRLRGAWQPCGNGVLPRGPGAARGV
jgi:hypothetical protein